MSSLVPKLTGMFRSTLTLASHRHISTTPAVMAMPAKRKRKMDPMVERTREEKRKKRLAKALKKMESKTRINKPLMEMEPGPALIKEAETIRARKIEVSEATIDERALLLKDWNRFCNVRYKNEIHQMDRAIMSQNRALEALRQESQELYSQAVAVDDTLLPFVASGPTATPAIPGYLHDGCYEEVTKQFAVQYGDMKSFMQQLLMHARKKKKKSAEAEEEED